MTRTRRLALAGAAILLASLALTACGGDDETASDDATTSAAPSETASEEASETASESPTQSATPSPSKTAPQGTIINIDFTDDSVTPNGKRVKAKVGEPITLNINASSPGELHVHATPEQEIEFPAGASVKTLTIDQPGIVDVEIHQLDEVVVQLEVS
jgi:uncharacterized protein YcfL